MSLTIIVRGLPGAGKNSFAVDLTKRLNRKYRNRTTFKVLNTERVDKVFHTPHERLDYIKDVMKWARIAHIPLFVVTESTSISTVNAIALEAKNSLIVKIVDDTVEHYPEHVQLFKDIWEDHPDEITFYRTTTDMEDTMEKIMELYHLYDNRPLQKESKPCSRT